MKNQCSEQSNSCSMIILCLCLDPMHLGTWDTFKKTQGSLLIYPWFGKIVNKSRFILIFPLIARDFEQSYLLSSNTGIHRD